jgi:hypothetical protein
MMKYLFCLFLSLSVLWTAKAQDMADFFVRMPDEYIPQLEEAWRKDLVELYRSGKTAALDNMMDGRSTLLKLTPDYLLLQSTDRSTVEMKFLPLVNQTHVVCVITTVTGPIADSRIAFFTTEWNPLPASDLWKPASRECFIKKEADRQSDAFLDAIAFLDMDLIHYRLSESETALTAQYTTPDYLSSQEREKVKPFLKETLLVYRWNHGRFEYEVE